MAGPLFAIAHASKTSCGFDFIVIYFDDVARLMPRFHYHFTPTQEIEPLTPHTHAGRNYSGQHKRGDLMLHCLFLHDLQRDRIAYIRSDAEIIRSRREIGRGEGRVVIARLLQLIFCISDGNRAA
jgi:hypothetical protein